MTDIIADLWVRLCLFLRTRYERMFEAPDDPLMTPGVNGLSTHLQHAGRLWRHVRAFNDRLAVLITAAVGTMWCAYVFVGLALSGFPGWQSPLVELVRWFSQTFLQLVFLPVLAVGGAVVARAAEKRHREVETRMVRMEREHGEQLRAMREIIADLHSHTHCLGHTTIDSDPQLTQGQRRHAVRRKGGSAA